MPALLAVCVLALAACGGTPSSATGSSSAPAPQAVTDAPTPSAGADDAAAACLARNTSNEPDILFRFKDPGTDWNTQRLGGGYAFNHTTDECQTSPDFFISSVPTGDGHCGQVAWASDNPGYDENATPSAPLKKVIAAVGNCE